MIYKAFWMHMLPPEDEINLQLAEEEPEYAHKEGPAE